MQWTSIYIYTGSDRIILLNSYLKPLIRLLEDEKQINGYFYILYNENGFHIRLRLKVTFNTNYVLCKAINVINKFFVDFPTGYIENRSPEYFPNDTVRIVPYEPELDRYCGDIGIMISERQFQNSTDIIWQFLENSKSESYSSLSSIAFKLNLTTAFIYCEGNIDEAIMFFEFICKGRILNYNSPYLKFRPEELLYSKYYNEQKEMIVPFVSAIWNGLANNIIVDDNVEAWKNAEFKIYSEVKSAYENDTITIPVIFETFPLWYLAQSYLHMSNNRLGINVIDEPLISYFMMRGLIDLNV